MDARHTSTAQDPEVDIVRLDLKKIMERWNPFTSLVWMVMKTPITEEEIRSAIESNQLIHPDSPRNMYLIWDQSTREEHISRIAWLVVNDDQMSHPIDVDFGIPTLGVSGGIEDGYHRLAAAIYLNKQCIYAFASGSESEIEKYKV